MMAVAGGPEPQPHRNQPPSTFELNAVARAGSENPPRIFGPKGVKGRCDFDRHGERLPVIIASHVKRVHVFDAEQEVDSAIAVRNRYRVVVGDVVGLALLPLERHRASLYSAGRVRDNALWGKGFAAVC